MQKLILYSTLGCHLCELAREEIEPCLEQTTWVLDEKDIADDPGLLEQYGTSIPVLFSAGLNDRLYWPFDRNAVKSFLDKGGR